MPPAAKKPAARKPAARKTTTRKTTARKTTARSTPARSASARSRVVVISIIARTPQPGARAAAPREAARRRAHHAAVGRQGTRSQRAERVQGRHQGADELAARSQEGEQERPQGLRQGQDRRRRQGADAQDDRAQAGRAQADRAQDDREQEHHAQRHARRRARARRGTRARAQQLVVAGHIDWAGCDPFPGADRRRSLPFERRHRPRRNRGLEPPSARRDRKPDP